MRIPSLPPLLALLLTGSLHPSALAGDGALLGFHGAVGSDGLPSPWKLERWWPVVGMGSYTAEARVVAPSGPGAPAGAVLELSCERAGFLVGSEREIDISEDHWASWSWRADTLPTGGSFRARETNDQVLQLLFGFEGGEVISYIWDGSGVVGATGSGLTWREDVRVMVLQAGAANQGRWVREHRDLAADFEQLFGHPPPSPLKGLAVQSNCQHTESSGHGYIGAVQLGPR